MRRSHATRYVRAHGFHRDVRVGRSLARRAGRVLDERGVFWTFRFARVARGGVRRGDRGGGRMLALGLMSGTSLDGIDAALVPILPRGEGYAFEVLASHTTPFDTGLRERIVAALPPNEPSPRVVATLD